MCWSNLTIYSYNVSYIPFFRSNVYTEAIYSYNVSYIHFSKSNVCTEAITNTMYFTYLFLETMYVLEPFTYIRSVRLIAP